METKKLSQLPVADTIENTKVLGTNGAGESVAVPIDLIRDGLATEESLSFVSTRVVVDIDFLDLTPFVYNVPEAMRLFQHQYETSAATLSLPLNTNMNKFTKLTIAPTSVGLITLTGILL